MSRDIRVSPGYISEATHPTCHKSNHQWSFALVVWPKHTCINEWPEMACQFFPGLIKLGLRHVSGNVFHAVPPSQGRGGVTITTTTCPLISACSRFGQGISFGLKLADIARHRHGHCRRVAFSSTPHLRFSYSTLLILILYLSTRERERVCMSK